jgi:hypothetical protein
MMAPSLAPTPNFFHFNHDMKGAETRANARDRQAMNNDTLPVTAGLWATTPAPPQQGSRV